MGAPPSCQQVNRINKEGVLIYQCGGSRVVEKARGGGARQQKGRTFTSRAAVAACSGLLSEAP